MNNRLMIATMLMAASISAPPGKQTPNQTECLDWADSLIAEELATRPRVEPDGKFRCQCLNIHGVEVPE